MAKKTQAPHIHNHHSVTMELVEAFGNARRSEQESALARLRSSLAFDFMAGYTSIVAVFLAMIAIFLSPVMPRLTELNSPEWSEATPLFIKVVLVGAIISAPFLVLLIMSFYWVGLGKQRIRSAVWLAAYEAELARRYADTSRAGKSWRKKRKIAWK